MKYFYLCIALLVTLNGVFGQTSYVWNGTTSTDWNTATNWTPNGIPLAADHVTMVTAANSCILDANRSITNLTITSGTLNLNGFTLGTTGVVACNSGSCINGTFNSTATSLTFAGTTFDAHVVANVTDVYFNGSTFNGNLTVVRTGSISIQSNGNNVYNGTTSITNAGSGYLLLTNGAAGRNETFNGPATFRTSNLGNLYIGYSRNVFFNANVTIENPSGTGFIQIGRVGTMALNTGVTLTCGTFAGTSLNLYGFTQADATAQVLSPGNNGNVNMYSCAFNGTVTVNAGYITAQTSTFAGAVTYNLAGTTANCPSPGGNTYNGVLTVNNSSSGYIGFGNGTADTYNADVYLTNTSTTGGRIIMGQNSSNNAFNGNIYVSQSGTTAASGIAVGWSGTFPVVSMGAGKSIFVNGTFSSGYLQLLRLQQADATAFTVSATNTASIYLQQNVFTGAVNVTSPDIYCFGGTYNAPVTFSKTGGANNHNSGYQNNFNSTCTINQTGSSGYFMLGYNSNDTFNDDITVSSTGTGGINLGWVGGTGTPTLAAGKTVKIGAAGFSDGYLRFGGFTQLGTAPVNLPMTGPAALYVERIATACTFGGTFTATAADLYIRGGVFNGATTFTKTGGVSDHNNGNQNIFNAPLTINQQSNSGYFMLGYYSNDLFNDNITVTNTGNQGIYLGYSTGTGTPTLAAGKTISIGGAGFTGGFLYLGGFTQLGTQPVNLTMTGTSTTLHMRASVFGGNMTLVSPSYALNGNAFGGTLNLTKTGPNSDANAGGNTFQGNCQFTNTGAGYLGFGWSSPDIWNGDVVFTNSGSERILLAWNTIGNQFNGNIVVNSTGSSTGIHFCGGSSGATVTLASGKNITTGTYTSGYLILRQFTQLGNAPLNLNLTSTATYVQYGPSSTFGGNVTSTSPRVFLHSSTFHGTLDVVKTGAGGDYSDGGNTFNGVMTLTNNGTSFLLLGNNQPDTWNADVTFTNNSTERLLPCWGTAGNVFNGNIYVNTSASAQGIQFCGGSGLATATLAATKTISTGTYNGGYLILRQFTQLGNAPVNLTMGATAGYLQYGPFSTFGGNVTSTSPRVFFQGATFHGNMDATKTGASGDNSDGGNVFHGTTTLTNSGTGQLQMGTTNADQFNGAATFNNTGEYRFVFASSHVNQTTVFASDLTLNSAKTGGTDAWSFFAAQGVNTSFVVNGHFTLNVSGTLQSNCQFLTNVGTTATYQGNVTLNMTNSHNNSQLYMGTLGTSTYNGNLVVTNATGGGSSGVFFNTGNISSSVLASGKTITLGGGGFVAGTLSLLRFTQLGTTSQSLIQPTGTALLILGPTSRFDGEVNFNFPRVLLNGTTYNGTATIQKNGAGDDSGTGGNIFNGTTTITNSGSGYLMTGNGTADQFNGSTTFNNTGSYRIYIAYSHNAQTTVFGSDVTFYSNKVSGTDGWAYYIADNLNTHIRFNGPVTVTMAGTQQSNFRILGGSGSTALYNGDVTLNQINSHSSTQLQMGQTGTSTYNGNIVVSNTAGGSGNGIFFNMNTSASSTLAATKTISIGFGFVTGTLSLLRFTQLGATPQTLVQPTGTAILTLGPTSRFDGDVNFNFPQVYLNGTTYNGTATIRKNGAGDNYGTGGNIFNGTTTITNSGSDYLLTGGNTADQFNASTTFNNISSDRIYVAHNHPSQTTVFGADVTFNANKSAAGDAWAYMIAENTNSHIVFNGPVTFNIAGSIQSTSRILNGSGSTALYNGHVTLNLTNSHSSTQLQMGQTGISTYNGNIIVSNTAGGSNSGIYFNPGGTASSTLSTGYSLSMGPGGFVAGTLSLIRFTQLGAAVNTLLQPTGAALLILGPTSRFDGEVNFNFPRVLLNGTTYNGTATIQKNGSIDDSGTGGNIFNGTTTITNSGSGYLMTGNGTADQFNGSTTFNNTGSYRMFIAHNHNAQTTVFGSDVTFNTSKASGSDGWAFFMAENFNTHVLFNGPVTFHVGGSVPSNCRLLNGGSTTVTYNGDVTVNMTNTNITTQMQMGTLGTSTYNGNIRINNIGGAAGVYFNTGASATSTLAAGRDMAVGGSGFTSGTVSLPRFTQLGATPQSLLLTGTAGLLFGPASTFNGNVTTTSWSLQYNTSTFNGTVTSTKNGTTTETSTGGNIFNGTLALTLTGTGYLRMANTIADAYNGDVIFAQDNTGALQPNYNTNCTYAGNIAVSSTGGYTLTFGSGSGTATLNGGNAQAISKAGSAGNPIFTRLVLAKSANDVTLSTRIHVSSTLTLTQGVLHTTAANILNMNNASATTIGSAISYVEGPMNYDMALNGSRTLNFPIGKGADWRPAVLTATHNNGTSYTYNAEVFNGNANSFGWTKPATITHVSTFHYWDINRTVTASGVSAPSTNVSGNQIITLYYDTSDEVSDPTRLTICKNTSAAPTAWSDIGGMGATAPAGSVTSTSSPSAFTSYSRFTLGNNINGFNPLPVTLLSLEAACAEGKVEVNWTTASQIRNEFFTIERSADGLDFQAIGQVTGAGTTSQLLSYRFTDTKPLTGQVYYRLKQTDTNGEYSYSKIVTVSCTGEATDMRVYPNPTADRLYIQASGEELSQLQLYNSLGQNRTHLITSKVGAAGVELDIHRLHPGIYVLKTRTATHTIYKQ